MTNDLPDPSPAQAARELGRGKPRLRVPSRNQAQVSWESLDQRLDPGFASAGWSGALSVSLISMPGSRRSRRFEHHVGRNAIDPRLLVALWVFATLRGVGSARELERLCEHHLAYQWLCGGVSVNYHTLADFALGGARSGTTCSRRLSPTAHERRLGHHGSGRAGWHESSCRRRQQLRFATGGTLEKRLAEAKQQVDTLKQLAETNPDELSRRQSAAKERAATERQERIENAKRECDELRRNKAERDKGKKEKSSEARASTTDPEARNMKFSDGGYRPGYNVQFGTDVASGIVVGVDVTNEGNDFEQMPPMLDQLEERYDTVPDEILIDGGFTSLDAIDSTENRGCKVYGPVKDEEKQTKAGKDPFARKRDDDTDQTAEWRKRMGEEASKATYKLRAQTAEWVNALCRNRGLQQMPVRGITKLSNHSDPVCDHA